MALHLQPNKFDLNRLKPGATCIMVAKRRSGKSVAIKELMHHFDVKCGIKAGVVCSHSEEVDPYYSNFFPSTYIYSDCAKMLRKVIERQEKLLEENERLRQEGKPQKDSRILVVLDDVIDDPTIAKNEDFNNIMFNGRHYNITLIIAVQYVKALPPGARQNFDYIFLFANDIGAEIKKMYDSFAGMFPTEKVFRTVLQTFTKNYQILVLDMTGGPNASLNDKFGVFKANINLSYDTFGCKAFNEFHQKHYNKDWKKSKKGGIQVGANGRDIAILY